MRQGARPAGPLTTLVLGLEDAPRHSLNLRGTCAPLSSASDDGGQEAGMEACRPALGRPRVAGGLH
jgi:hypothetical protein